MKFITREAPHIHHSDSVRTVMGDVILALLPLYFISFCFYGPRVLILGLASVVTCYLTDIICTKLRGRRYNPNDISSIVTAMIITLMLPASIDYHVAVIAGLFAILVVKQPFGGIGQNIFNPAAAGIAFVTACWPTKVFSYPLLFDKLPLFGSYTGTLTNSTAYVLKMGGVPSLDTSEMFLGILPGPMGATNILVIMACLIFLSYRKTISLYQVISFVGGVAVFSMLFPRIAVSPMNSFIFEIMSGSLLFGGVFMLTDPATTPRRTSARIAYGFTAGVLVMIMRSFGGLEQSIAFAVLLMNIFTSMFDWVAEKQFNMKERGGKNAVSKNPKLKAKA